MLTDEQIQYIRKKVSEESGEWHFDTLKFGREVERAVIDHIERSRHMVEQSEDKRGADQPENLHYLIERVRKWGIENTGNEPSVSCFHRAVDELANAVGCHDAALKFPTENKP